MQHKRLVEIDNWRFNKSGCYHVIVAFTKGKVGCPVEFQIDISNGIKNCDIFWYSRTEPGDAELDSLYRTWYDYYMANNVWYADMTFFDFAYLSGWDSEISATIEL